MTKRASARADDGAPQFFKSVFSAAIEKLEVDAALHGVSMTEVFRAAGVSRTTLYRHKKRPPATVIALDNLQRHLVRLAAKKAAK